jgi:hypothetical protein
VLTRIEADAVIPPSGCTNNIVLQVSDGTSAGTKTLVLAADENDSGPLSVNYSAGSTLRLSVVPPSGCVTPASSINITVQYPRPLNKRTPEFHSSGVSHLRIIAHFGTRKAAPG